MKRIIQCVFTRMEGDSFQFGIFGDQDRCELIKTSLRNVGEGSTKAYSYFTDLDDLDVGDLVVVSCEGSSSRMGLAICQVSAVEGLTRHQREKATQWVVQKIDLETHTKRMKQAAVEQEIWNKLEERRAEMEALMVYKALAQNDPEIAKLIERLAEFDPSAKALLPEKTEGKSAKKKK